MWHFWHLHVLYKCLLYKPFPLICIKAVAFTCVWAMLTSEYRIFKACSEPFRACHGSQSHPISHLKAVIICFPQIEVHCRHFTAFTVLHLMYAYIEWCDQCLDFNYQLSVYSASTSLFHVSLLTELHWLLLLLLTAWMMRRDYGQTTAMQ